MNIGEKSACNVQFNGLQIIQAVFKLRGQNTIKKTALKRR